MTLNGVMAVTLRYFNEFGKPAFQLITASSNTELIDQNFKRSRDPFPTPRPNFAYCSLVPLLFYMLDKFEVSSYNRSQDIEGITIFQNYM